MKKSICIIFIVLIALLLILSSLYVTDYIKMKNNEPVVFSTWGKKYAPIKEITPEKAVEYTNKMLDDKSKETIKNLNNPKIEDVVFNKAPSIYLFNEKTKVVGRNLYKITYNTEQDGLLGPIVFYVDKLNGEIVGMDYRV